MKKYHAGDLRKPTRTLTKESLESIPNVPITTRISDRKDDPVNATMLAGCRADVGTACISCGARSIVDLTDDELYTWMGAWTMALNVKEALELIDEAALEACIEESKLSSIKKSRKSK